MYNHSESSKCRFFVTLQTDNSRSGVCYPIRQRVFRVLSTSSHTYTLRKIYINTPRWSSFGKKKKKKKEKLNLRSATELTGLIKKEQRPPRRGRPRNGRTCPTALPLSARACRARRARRARHALPRRPRGCSKRDAANGTDSLNLSPPRPGKSVTSQHIF